MTTETEESIQTHDNIAAYCEWKLGQGRNPEGNLKPPILNENKKDNIPKSLRLNGNGYDMTV